TKYRCWRFLCKSGQTETSVPRTPIIVYMENQRINQAFQIASLIRKHVEGTLDESEQQELDTWLDDDENNRKLFENLIESGDIASYEQSFLEVNTTDALVRFKKHYSLINRPSRRL